MAAKRSKKAGKKVKSLRARSVSGTQARRIKGGLNPQPLPPREHPPGLAFKGDPIGKI